MCSPLCPVVAVAGGGEGVALREEPVPLTLFHEATSESQTLVELVRAFLGACFPLLLSVLVSPDPCRLNTGRKPRVCETGKSYWRRVVLVALLTTKVKPVLPRSDTGGFPCSSCCVENFGVPKRGLLGLLWGLTGLEFSSLRSSGLLGSALLSHERL